MKKIIFFVAAVITTNANLRAQGCSDAGFCSLKYHISDTAGIYKNTVTLGNISGLADANTFVNSSYLSYNKKISESVYWDLKITANYASGSIARNFNAGDLFNSVNFIAYTGKKNVIKALAGCKIPLSASNNKAGGKPLPLTYQSSLGTFDALAGISLAAKNWEFTGACQLPLTRYNKNSFLKEYAVTSEFPSTNKFERKADVLLKTVYEFKNISNAFSVKPGLLAIYHTGTDTYENIYALRQPLSGSQGLTLNATAAGIYTINKRSMFEVTLAAPFVVRKIRPDGLTRAFTAAIEYKFSF